MRGNKANRGRYDSRSPGQIEHRSAHYDAVVCFCAPKARRQLERMVAELRSPKLIVRDLAGG